MEAELEAKYRKLGFEPEGLSFKLRIGNVDLVAVEHPWKGVVVIFTSVSRREMTQFEAGVAAECTVEQIAGIIYANFKSNFRSQAEDCKSYFEGLGVEPFDYFKNRSKTQ